MSIQTFSGKLFDPLEPRMEDITIVDIAHALSMQCRFTGHVRQFYSVAEHSVNVSHLVPRELALAGLLHDASEAYISDVARPIKHLPEMAAYRKAEARIEVVIGRKFGVCLSPQHELIGQIDRGLCRNEADQLLAPLKDTWTFVALPNVGRLECWDPKTAYSRFMSRYFEIVRAMRQQERKAA